HLDGRKNGSLETAVAVIFADLRPDVPHKCSDIAAEISAAMSEHYFGTFSMRRQPAAAVSFTSTLQIFPKVNRP
ncbi:MAG: hypothetical protein LRY35_04355, partial [Clostridiales bacterium]|nr:hypothetical protein [Clostridiales bacterium]